MRSFLIPAVLVLALTVGVGASPAHAAGCLKGAAVGGLAGHVAGHHGVLGAGAGCAIGHHEANKQAHQQSGSSTAPANNGGNGASH